MIPETAETQTEAAQEQPSRPVSLRIIVLGVLTLVLAVLIATQVIGVLYAIVFPPAPPVPENSTLTSHIGSDYGVDTWLYTSQQSPCDVLNYYVTQGGQCRLSPGVCESNTTESTGSRSAQHVARCIGTTSFSLFALRWQAVIASGGSADVATEFRLEREIFWSGSVPPLIEP